MDLSEPIRGVIPGLTGPVLEVLAGSKRALTGREVARRVEGRGSQRGVLDVLNHLVEHGIVHREDHPPAALFRLNRDHVAADAVVELSRLPERLRDEIRGHVEHWSIPARGVSIFGSAARGDGGTDSDIDLLVVRSDAVGADHHVWEGQVADLAERVHRWSGNRASIIEYSVSELRAAWTAGAPLVREQLFHGAARVAGASVSELIALGDGASR